MLKHLWASCSSLHWGWIFCRCDTKWSSHSKYVLQQDFITCKRGSSKYCVTDDFAFLWKHVNFGYPQNRDALDRPKRNFAQLIMLLRRTSVQKFVKIGQLGVFLEWVKYHGFAYSSFSTVTHLQPKPNVRPMHIIYQKMWFEPRMCLSGSQNKSFLFAESYPKTPSFGE
jgi:hypothetical protein